MRIKIITFFKKSLIIALLSMMVICGCKKEETVTKQNGFSINGEGNFHNTPFAYVRKEGYDSKKNIYYLSLTFPTGAVVMDTVSKNFKGFGEAIKFYIYSPTLKDIPLGKYTYKNPMDTSNLFLQIHKIYLYTNNYAFTYTPNQKGFLTKDCKNGLLNISKTGTDFVIDYNATMTKKDMNSNDVDSWIIGEYKGNLVFP